MNRFCLDTTWRRANSKCKHYRDPHRDRPDPSISTAVDTSKFHYFCPELTHGNMQMSKCTRNTTRTKMRDAYFPGRLSNLRAHVYHSSSNTSDWFVYRPFSCDVIFDNWLRWVEIGPACLNSSGTHVHESVNVCQGSMHLAFLFLVCFSYI